MVPPPAYRPAVREFCAPITRIARISASFTLGMNAAASILREKGVIE